MNNVVIDAMQTTFEPVQELRRLFLDKLRQEYNDSPNLFHPYDVDRVKHSDVWLNRFINHHEGDVRDALNMLWDTCEWRKSMEVNEISEQNVCMEYLTEGSLFPYGCDKDNKIMLVFKCKMHFKGLKNLEELKRCLIYWFERLERQTNGDQITIFFDMMDTGLSNMDMEFSKYLINLNKLYYPSFLNYILIYEMPWVLNAAFIIIKSWLPARAVQKIKFLNKTSIKEYVNPNKLLTCWGGDDELVFAFNPEIKTELASSSHSPSTKSEEIKKKTVHFALNHSSAESSPVSSSFRDMKPEDDAAAPLIRVIHSEAVHFNWNGSEFIGSINVENISHKNILYKIKTTSPDRFRVRPNSGILQHGVSAKITIVLLSGCQIQSILKDKFLVMAMPTEKEDVPPQEIIEIWKQSENVKVEQYRLKCSIVEPVPNTLPSNGNVSSAVADDLADKIDQLKSVMYQICECNKKFHKDISYRQNMITVILSLFILVVLLLLYFVYKNPSTGLRNSVMHPSCAVSFNDENA